MKKNHIIIISLFFCSFSAYGQEIRDTVLVSFTKSVYLVFDKKPSFDAGSEDIIVREHENKLIIQAAVENFEETNLFVQVGGRMYMFIIVYGRNPKKYLYNYQGESISIPDAKTDPDGLKSGTFFYDSLSNTMNDMSYRDKELIAKYRADSAEAYFSPRCEKVHSSRNHPMNQGAIAYGCLVFCPVMYTDNNHFYIKIIIENTTNINYDVDYLSFVIRTRKALLRKNTMQDYSIRPVYLYKTFTRIGGKSKHAMVAVFDKFTIDRMKLFTAEIWEKNGDRRINLDIDGNVFLSILPFSAI